MICSPHNQVTTSEIHRNGYYINSDINVFCRCFSRFNQRAAYVRDDHHSVGDAGNAVAGLDVHTHVCTYPNDRARLLA